MVTPFQRSTGAGRRPGRRPRQRTEQIDEAERRLAESGPTTPACRADGPARIPGSRERQRRGERARDPVARRRTEQKVDQAAEQSRHGGSDWRRELHVKGGRNGDSGILQEPPVDHHPDLDDDTVQKNQAEYTRLENGVGQDRSSPQHEVVLNGQTHTGPRRRGEPVVVLVEVNEDHCGLCIRMPMADVEDGASCHPVRLDQRVQPCRPGHGGKRPPGSQEPPIAQETTWITTRSRRNSTSTVGSQIDTRRLRDVADRAAHRASASRATSSTGHRGNVSCLPT